MEIVKREDITGDIYREILDKETHHNHEIIKDKYGTLRWKSNFNTEHYSESISLNDLIQLFNSLGIDKNHEIYRLYYRNIGYSLHGYWEIFYWEMNNEDYHLYNPPGPSDSVILPINTHKIVKLSLELEKISKDLIKCLIKKDE